VRSGKPAGIAQGFTLAEVVISLGIAGMLFAGIMIGYVQSSRQAEWAGYLLAAQSCGIHQIEQARAAMWEVGNNPANSRNELTNLNLLSWTYNTTTMVGKGYTTNVLDVPRSGTNFVMATNYVTVRTYLLTAFTNARVQMVTVDTVWPFPTKTGNRYFTNTTATYLGPDDRDFNNL